MSNQLQVTDDRPVPGEPVFIHPHDITHGDRQYTVFYRHGNKPNCSKTFNFKGSFRQATERAKMHCQIMGYRFVFLSPVLSILEEDEKNRENGISV